MTVEQRSGTAEVHGGGQPGPDELLSRGQMFRRYHGEWLLIDAPEVNPSVGVVRGRVVWHSPSRDDVYRKAKALRLKYGAFLYAGPVPGDDGMEIVL